MSDIVSIPASAFPRDTDGFLSRECPACEGRFKVKVDDQAEDRPDVSKEEMLAEADAMRRYCPLCHQLVEGNQWWTPEQLEFATDAIGAAVQLEFQRVLRETAQNSNGVLEFQGGPPPAIPSPPEESDDMALVTLPCHEEDPLKVPEGWTQEVACHVCGFRYPVDVVRL